MRHLDVLVPAGKGKQVLDIAGRYGGVNLSVSESSTPNGKMDLALVNIPNNRLEGFVAEIDRIRDVRFTFPPTGFITMYPPEDQVAEQATEVSDLSPIEVYVSGLQSIGTWTSFLGYAVVAGIIAWSGMYTNTVYLLVAAMLIAPYAGPAMNAAIATARGDFGLLWHSLLRYFISLLVTVLVAAILSFAFGQRIETSMMVSVSKISAAYVLLPLAAGAAGALNLAQSERSSLISGTAVGLMVSVSLAPPAALIGMAAVIGRWDLLDNGIFTLLLTIFSINLGSLLVLRRHGLTPDGARYHRGRSLVFYLMSGLTVLALLGLLAWQFSALPELQRSTREERATLALRDAVEQSGWARFIDASVRYTVPESDENVLLASVYVEKQPGTALSAAEIKQALTGLIQDRLQGKEFNAIPLVDVTVLEGPRR